MGTVIMRHPDPDVPGEIEVAESAVPHLAPSGWQLVPEEELKAREEAARAKVLKAIEAERAAAAADVEGEAGPDESEPAEQPVKEPAPRKRTAAKKSPDNPAE